MLNENPLHILPRVNCLFWQAFYPHASRSIQHKGEEAHGTVSVAIIKVDRADIIRKPSLRIGGAVVFCHKLCYVRQSGRENLLNDGPTETLGA